MRITKKIELINKLAKAINDRFDVIDKEHFFKSFDSGILIEWDQEYDNEYSINVKKTLHTLTNITLIEIAEELEVATEHIILSPPKNWEKSNLAKAFISHTSKNKGVAMKLKDALKPFNIDCFVAHEDIKPSEEWQEEIDKALQTMDFFISIHTDGFAESTWCQQEVGYAVAKSAKIIPIKFDGKQDPAGFIGKIQALSRNGKTSQMVAKEIIELLKTDKKTKNLYEEKINPTTVEEDEDECPF
jgi:hypothetical protein